MRATSPPRRDAARQQPRLSCRRERRKPSDRRGAMRRKELSLGSVGADDFGGRMLAYLQENGVDTCGVSVERRFDRPRGHHCRCARRKHDRRDARRECACESTGAFAREYDRRGGCAGAARNANRRDRGPICRVLKANGGTTILNPSPYRPLAQELLQNTTMLIANEEELAQLTGRPASADPRDIIPARNTTDCPLPSCIITLGSAGLILAERDRAAIHFGGHEVEAIDTTGAGDCFAGWFAAELAAGRSLEDAARRANAAAAISVTRAGAGPSVPTKSEVESFLNR